MPIARPSAAQARLAEPPRRRICHFVHAEFGRRKGRSMNSNDTNAMDSERKITSTVCRPVKLWTQKYSRNTMMGQCHKYNEYEMTPIKAKGRILSMDLTEEAPVWLA